MDKKIRIVEDIIYKKAQLVVRGIIKAEIVNIKELAKEIVEKLEKL
jgi:hypothetical protein